MTPTRTRRWPLWLFRAAITGEAVFALAQALLAGGYLAGNYEFLQLHAKNATNTGIAAIVLTACAVVWWKPGGGPWWPILASAGLFAAEALQIVLGYGRVLAVHVPLGVTIIASVGLLLVRAWRAPAGKTA